MWFWIRYTDRHGLIALLRIHLPSEAQAREWFARLLPNQTILEIRSEAEDVQPERNAHGFRRSP
jgi:hypothetical protein